jgi:molecular chaperone GrpE
MGAYSIHYRMTEEKNIASEDSSDKIKAEPLQIPELTEVDMLSSRIAELENSVIQLKDQLLRKAAEFENYKRRIENDSVNLVRFANEDLIVKLLPVVDDFERSLKVKLPAGDEGDELYTILRGIELIYSKFRKILEANGVKDMDVVGKPFDPNYHDALLQLPRADVPPHTVLEEVDKGYMMNDKVIRHARVIVSADVPEAAPGDARDESAGQAP